VTLALQLAPAASTAGASGHVSVEANSPAIVISRNVRGAKPLFVMVMSVGGALVVFTA
jgi:hypothetical protein